MGIVHMIELNPNTIPNDLKKYFRPKRKYGPYILRNTLIWHKPNCMPSSVKDRFTADFEYIFFFVKNKKYWFETQFEPLTDYDRATHRLLDPTNKNRKQQYDGKSLRGQGINPATAEKTRQRMLTKGRNKRCVWRITTKPFKEAHFAVFPEELVETPIKAGCPEGGIVLDPFIGSGTVAIVAKKNNRNWVGIDLNPEYIKMANKRINNTMERLV